MKSGYILLGIIIVISIAIVAVMVMMPSPRKIQTPLTSTTTINQSELMAALEPGLVSTNMNAQTAVFAIPPANTTVSPCILAGLG